MAVCVVCDRGDGGLELCDLEGLLVSVGTLRS